MGRTKSRPMIQAESLARRLALLDYIEKNGPVYTTKIVADLGYPKATVVQWLAGMEETGHVLLHIIGDGRNSCAFVRGPNQIPLANFKLGGGMYVRDMQVQSRTVKATQIGMVRDSLIEALFGPARAVA